MIDEVLDQRETIPDDISVCRMQFGSSCASSSEVNIGPKISLVCIKLHPLEARIKEAVYICYCVR